jgi:hypothetical protein
MLATEVSTESTPDAYRDPDSYRPCEHPAYTNAEESSLQVAVQSSSTRERKVRIFAAAVEKIAMLVGVRVRSEQALLYEASHDNCHVSSACRPGGGSDTMDLLG